MKDIFRLSRLLDSSFGSLSYCRSQTRFTFHCHDWLRDIFLTICVESIHPSICAIFPMPLTPLQEISTSMLNSKNYYFSHQMLLHFFSFQRIFDDWGHKNQYKLYVSMACCFKNDSNTSTWSLLVQVKPLSASANPTCNDILCWYLFIGLPTLELSVTHLSDFESSA